MTPQNTRQDRSHALRQVAKAANRRQRADDSRREATAELREWCRRAHDAGITITEIAGVAGLSRQGVYDLLSQPPAQRA
jgi:hypothetical protein